MSEVIPPIGPDKPWWTFVLHNAPILSPFIWLGWFFGRNYGHTVRLEEDYAFKESISKSFQGFRKQMQEVDSTGALKNLCAKTISILSEPPLRVFDRKTHDETPAHSFLGQFFPRAKKSEENRNDTSE